MRPYNIFLIVIDCVRNYCSGKDDRDKLKIMFDLDEKWGSFVNMVSPAPSSIMAIASALTGVPAYFLAKTYDDFETSCMLPRTLIDILRENGYYCRSIMNARAAREKMEGIIPHLEGYYWKQMVHHREKRWSNRAVRDIFFNYLNNPPQNKELLFTLIWYNSRRDPEISNIVEETLARIEDLGFFNNSIIIVCSDHGYPDKRRGLVSDGCDLKKMGIPHDIILTDDNILIPFYIYYPGIKQKQIKNMYAWYDLFPSILELLRIDEDGVYQYFSKSFIPEFTGENKLDDERIVRIDNRFYRQDRRITALRTNRYKYYIEHQSTEEQIFDLHHDRWEEKNLISHFDEVILNKFRTCFSKSEDLIYAFLFLDMLRRNKFIQKNNLIIELRGFKPVEWFIEKWFWTNENKDINSTKKCIFFSKRLSKDEVVREFSLSRGDVILVDPQYIYYNKNYKLQLIRNYIQRLITKMKTRKRWVKEHPGLFFEYLRKFLFK